MPTRLKAQEGATTAPAFCVRIAPLLPDVVHVWDQGVLHHHDVPSADYALALGDDGIATLHLREGATFAFKFVIDDTHWVHDPVLPSALDEQGRTNNVITVRAAASSPAASVRGR